MHVASFRFLGCVQESDAPPETRYQGENVVRSRTSHEISSFYYLLEHPSKIQVINPCIALVGKFLFWRGGGGLEAASRCCWFCRLLLWKEAAAFSSSRTLPSTAEAAFG